MKNNVLLIYIIIYVCNFSFSQYSTEGCYKRCSNLQTEGREELVFVDKQKKHFLYILDNKFFEILNCRHRPIISWGQINTDGSLSYSFDLTGYEPFFKYLLDLEFNYRFLYYENSDNNTIVFDSTINQFKIRLDCDLEYSIPKGNFSQEFEDSMTYSDDGIVQVEFLENRKNDDFYFISGGIINNIVEDKGRLLINVFSGFSDIIYSFPNETNIDSLMYIGKYVKKGEEIKGVKNENINIQMILNCIIK